MSGNGTHRLVEVCDGLLTLRRQREDVGESEALALTDLDRRVNAVQSILSFLNNLVEVGLLVGDYLGLSRTVVFDSVGAVGKGDSDTSQDESEGCDGGDDLCVWSSTLG
ncbi:MAG: hypothetical protein E6212_02575 [Actinomyces sp.]|nr:hypothetical protein [Actinomyces sp.]